MTEISDQRLKAWSALSELFLDTELSDKNFESIAVRLYKTGYPLIEIERILWNEVYPILKFNLITVAGEWAYFSDEWLLLNLKTNQKNKRPFLFPANEIKSSWLNVKVKINASE